MVLGLTRAAAYDGPAALTWGRALTTSHDDVLVLVVGVALLGTYRSARRALGKQGQHWAAGRTTAFYLGITLLVLVCISSLGAYAPVLAWAYAAQLALLLTAVPVLLALGQPIELVQRAWPKRSRPGGVQPNALVRVLTFPLVGMLLVTLLPFAIWFTGWYAASLRHTLIAGLTHLAAVAAGFVFFWPVLDADDERRLPWPAATAVVFVETVLDSIPGIVVWLRGTLLAPGYWATLARPWGRTPLNDQKFGGLVFWGIGEVVGLPILIVTVARWIRADAREAARIDAALDAAEAREATQMTEERLRRRDGA